ncbi:fluoride efflux transporter CrcB [Cytobacillus dafuensis]|uniref:Fluoride-specific ion channel FluC n=1 Tax=Cytobacillus dafuensis TaxID=1742359 RepID=A0A5B8Z9T0_CYTDA|nr:fluoride efflux transporter CrcB [Cytobacillus dafuensis]QED48226.1 fluoride efflux transporter CrcB [Cytobacillus dafuensis]
MIWLIGVGGSFGALLRYLIGDLINNRSKGTFPLGTWIINLTGSLLLGLLAKLHITNQIQDWVWFLFGIGFCGAFTTFSTFSYETVKLLLEKQYKIAFIYVITSVFFSVTGAAIVFFI